MQLLLKSSILLLTGLATTSVEAQGTGTPANQGRQPASGQGSQPGTGSPQPQNAQNPSVNGAMTPAGSSQQANGAPLPQSLQNSNNQPNIGMGAAYPFAQQANGAPLPRSWQYPANANGANSGFTPVTQQGTGSPIPYSNQNQAPSQNNPLATGYILPQGTIYPGGYQGFNFQNQGLQFTGINRGINQAGAMSAQPQQGTQLGTGGPLPQNLENPTGMQPGNLASPIPGTQPGTGAPVPQNLQNPITNQAVYQNGQNLLAANNVEVFGQVNPTPWFADPIVRARLNISNEQATILGRAYAQSWEVYRNSAGALMNQTTLTPEQQQQLVQLHHQFYADFGRFSNIILEGNQSGRFSQLALQYRGYQALLDPAISQRLQLNSEQRSQLTRLSQEQQQQLRELYTPGSANSSAAESRFNQIRREMSVRIDQVLTDAQRQAWRELMGEPYEFIYRGY